MILPNLIFLMAITIVYLLIIWKINANVDVPMYTLILGEWDLLLLSGQVVSVVFMFIGVLILSIDGAWPRWIPISWELVVMMAIVLFRTLSDLLTVTSKIQKKYGKIITEDLDSKSK